MSETIGNNVMFSSISPAYGMRFVEKKYKEDIAVERYDEALSGRGMRRALLVYYKLPFYPGRDETKGKTFKFIVNKDMIFSLDRPPVKNLYWVLVEMYVPRSFPGFENEQYGQELEICIEKAEKIVLIELDRIWSIMFEGREPIPFEFEG
jgi:hypothetical protein